MRILIADDDPSFRRFAAEALRVRVPHHEVVVVSDGAQALEKTLSDRNFDVLVLDWLMPKLTGTQVCRVIRGDTLVCQPYILFATSRRRREELFECLSAGADELLTKPIAPDIFVERIELANCRKASVNANDGAVRAAIISASEEGQGELVVRSGDISARIFFNEGRVAWAHVADGSEGLLRALEPDLGVDRETVRAAVEESRTSGTALSETLVSWGLASRARLRESIGVWIRKKIEIILGLPKPQALFLPQKRAHSEELLFELDEVMDVPVVRSGIERVLRSSLPEEVPPTLIPGRGWGSAFLPSPTLEPRCSTILDGCMSCEGFLGAAILERTTGYCIERRGCDLNPDTVWAHIHCLNVISEEEADVEDTVVCAGKRYHLARMVPGLPNAFVYAVVDATSTPLATARFGLRRALEEVAGTISARAAV